MKSAPAAPPPGSILLHDYPAPIGEVEVQWVQVKTSRVPRWNAGKRD